MIMCIPSTSHFFLLSHLFPNFLQLNKKKKKTGIGGRKATSRKPKPASHQKNQNDVDQNVEGNNITYIKPFDIHSNGKMYVLLILSFTDNGTEAQVKKLTYDLTSSSGQIQNSKSGEVAPDAYVREILYTFKKQGKIP